MDDSLSRQQRRDRNGSQVSRQNMAQKIKQPSSLRQGQPKLRASDRQQDANSLDWNQDRPYPVAQQSIHTDLEPHNQAFDPAQPSNSASDLHQLSPVSKSSARYLSHISALSSARPGAYSRPISEISTEGVLTPKESRDDMKKYFVSPSTTPRKGRSIASTSASQSRSGHPAQADVMPSGDSAATMQALTSAIRQGLGPSKASSRSTTPKPFSAISAIRMPFQDEPSSPSSVYTEVIATQNRDTLPVSTFSGYNPRESRPSTISEHEVEDYEKFQFADGMPTPISQVSTDPILQNEGAGMSSRIPASKRPPKLDMGAVREAEARGSMTSLSDLIKRATRLASNLDRGRTASRLDMFGSSEKLTHAKARNSTYSDVLAAFPPPADGTTTPGRDRPATMWPGSGKQFMMSKSSLGIYGDGNEDNKQKRQCCGLPLFAFVLMLVVLILLIAAAVLIPIFLIVLPKHYQKSTGDCSTSHTCHNNGIAVVSIGQCSCICVGGYTGSDCSHESDPECTTASLYDGIKLYENATIGTALLPILQPQAQIHGIPLNTTTVLATFAANNLSCASENSLVVFNQKSNTRAIRSLTVDKNSLSSELSGFRMVPERQRRQDATQSANGIVFATSSQQSQATATASSPSATTSATDDTQSVTSNVTLSFAGAVVLYVLQTNSDINSAVTAKQAMTAYFGEKQPTNHTVVLTGGSQHLAVNFDTFEINLANGTNLGGK